MVKENISFYNLGKMYRNSIHSLVNFSFLDETKHGSRDVNNCTRKSCTYAFPIQRTVY